MAVVDPGINPAIFSSSSALLSGEAHYPNSGAVNHASRIEPIKHISGGSLPNMRDLEENAGILFVKGDEDEKKNILHKLREKWREVSKRKGVYNSMYHYEPSPPLGMFVDIYC